MRQRIKKIILWWGYKTFKIARRSVYLYQKIFKIKTRGVRVLLVYENSLVLVRHWYNSWWVMPGGGVKKNETPEQAAIRELKEEVGIEDIQLEYLLGQYSNITEGKNDTVYCYVVLLERPLGLKHKKFNIEISDVCMSKFTDLPEKTSQATRQRILEFINGQVSGEMREW